MNRTTMPADHGMLFIFDKPDTYSFWMKNTLIPLDIIFLDSTGKVLRHRPPGTPLDETGHGPSTPALYVIELNVGIADAIGLKTGRFRRPTREIPKDTLAPPPKSKSGKSTQSHFSPPPAPRQAAVPHRASAICRIRVISFLYALMRPGK